MAFFDYNRDGKKDMKDNAREYYLYKKVKEDEKKQETLPNSGIDAGCGTVFLCFLFLFFAIQIAIWVNSL